MNREWTGGDLKFEWIDEEVKWWKNEWTLNEYNNLQHSYILNFEGPLCGTCGGNTTITILRFLCKENCEYQEYTVYYATVILS